MVASLGVSTLVSAIFPRQYKLLLSNILCSLTPARALGLSSLSAAVTADWEIHICEERQLILAQ